MAKSAVAGEMKTKITIKRLVTGIDPSGYQTKRWEDIFPGKVWCKWVNAHGQEVYDNLRLELNETATITMRYSDKVDVRCRIWRERDDETGDEKEREKRAWEIISLDNVEDGRRFLELKVKRAVVA